MLRKNIWTWKIPPVYLYAEKLLILLRYSIQINIHDLKIENSDHILPNLVFFYIITAFLTVFLL
ncbi:MAG: hypothetical protein A2504_12885 [Bdellovibrionales bacterium RIFOXYD12_FULL_39_22]|nr:MAG: hypothetical protein A2451_01255 [Bdellovibrionales bacterium RIFOXYC2_FULL_39_8]OFZ77635.1 MAG: hypothetical protein A2560_04730 [Bdellovibrionales bacterium RIFOXYD1_FULL_39_84]OFZ96089.1 MAG: hypothetical protein A2504_12885 [Bdellovibrionales bacterium RIFOXYD12_FULL_39_22]